MTESRWVEANEGAGRGLPGFIGPWLYLPFLLVLAGIMAI